jgi:ketosteroid isomerase-like protein
MSQRNVETLRATNAAFNRGDAASALARYHPQVEVRDMQPAPDAPERMFGVAALEAYLAQWLDAFDEFTAEIEEYIDAGESVITLTHWRGRGKDSGIAVDVRTVDVFEFAGGKIVRATFGYADREAALEAVAAEE